VAKTRDTLEDGSGHGTHVAGIVAAIDNGIDAVGVAAGATVHPVRVLGNNDWGTFDEIICGIEYVANHASASRGDVANMSLYTTAEYPPLREAMRIASQNPHPVDCPDCKGIRFAVCAGNESDDLYDTAATYDPAEMGDLPNIYTVSTVDNSKQFWSGSNYDSGPAYGMGKIAFTAPGVHIPSLKRGGGVWHWTGCSQASPHVAGILLLTNTPGQNGQALDDPDGYPDPFVYYNAP
jgi:subtilisin family serine protease